MKLPITIEYTAGKQETYTAQPPEWRKWEKDTGNIISQAQEKIGISDLLFLAYHAMKREAAGQPVKPLDAWMDSVEEVDVSIDSPKAIAEEVSADS
jgi:hypothetical protein